MSSRRDFLKQSSVLSAALLIRPSGWLKVSKDVGLQLYTLRDLISKDPKGVLKQVAALGYKQVETFGYKDGKWFGLTAMELASELRTNGLTSPSGHTFPGSTFLKPGWEEKWKTAVADSKLIGQKYIVIPWLEEEYRKDADNYKRVAEGLNKAAQIAKATGLGLAYHNHDFEFQPVGSETGFDLLIKNTDKKLVQFELDIYWAEKAGRKAVDLFDQHPGRFPMWHVKDMDKTDKKFFTEVGNGVIDFKAIFAKAKESGMKYYFVEQDQTPGSPIDSITKSIEYIKANLAK